MLDVKFIRDNPDVVRRAMQLKGDEANLDRLLELDNNRRVMLKDVEELKHRRNVVSKEIGNRKAKGGEAGEKVAEMRQVADRIREMDDKLRLLNEEMEQILLHIPNIPDEEVPPGATEEDNVETRRWGEQPRFDFEPKTHWDLGADLNILDFPRAGKITGSRFAIYYGLGAQLERALINFMLDLHVREHGYHEVFPPFMVNSESMTGTGQLPKFAEDAFKIEGRDYYLVPTAEVPVTNLHRNEILQEDELPIYYVAYTACFRAEAGAHGRDTRGLIRQHQFNKVELVKFVTPRSSDDELESLVANAEKVLQLLNIPYRVMLMCAGDLGLRRQKIRSGDMDALCPDLPRSILLQQFPRFPVPQGADTFSPGGQGKGRICPYPEWLGAGHRPHGCCIDGKLSTEGWKYCHSRGSEEIFPRPDDYRYPFESLKG